MPQIRHDDQRLEDISFLMTLEERVENTLESMGLFSKDYLTGTLASFEREVTGSEDMYAVERGADRQMVGNSEAEIAHFNVPFFTLDGVTKPHEIQDLRQFGTADAPETVENKVKGIIRRIQTSHQKVHRKAMYAALKGKTYAVNRKNGDMKKYVKTFQTAFGIADADMFGGAAEGKKAYTIADANDPMAEFENFRKHISKVAGDNGDEYELVMLIGSSAFTKLKNNPFVKEGFTNYTDGVSLRKRLGGKKTNRAFEFEGISFMEDPNLGANEGVIFAKGLVDFQIKYAPADTEEHVNTVAEEAYLFMDRGRRHTTVESETSFVCVNTRPDCVGIYDFS